MYELLALLLPIAAISGWWLGQRSAIKTKRVDNEPDPAYFRGLNYLLNEQPDKAIDLFIKLLEVDTDTVETHLALGNLFRRRGEVDRAIRIHQNLMSRPTLDRRQRALALAELGQDYMRAGLFDRAENLFRELVNVDQHCELALSSLKEIYQQEKDWVRCLEIVNQLEVKCGHNQGIEKAHYYCEQAEEALKTKQLQSAWDLSCQAALANPQCVRTAMMQAQIEQARHNIKAAIDYYHQAIHQDPDIISEAIYGLSVCYKQSGLDHALIDYLRSLYNKKRDTKILLALTELLQQASENAEAEHLIGEHLRQHTDLLSVERFIDITRRTVVGEECSSALKMLHNSVHSLCKKQPNYTCTHCGFAAHQMHWHCPGCKGWNTIRSVTIDGSVATTDAD